MERVPTFVQNTGAMKLFLILAAAVFGNQKFDMKSFQRFMKMKQMKEMKELGIPLREILVQNAIARNLPSSFSTFINRRKIKKKKKEIEEMTRPKWVNVELEAESFSVAKSSFRSWRDGRVGDYADSSLALFTDEGLTNRVQ